MVCIYIYYVYFMWDIYIIYIYTHKFQSTENSKVNEDSDRQEQNSCKHFTLSDK